MRVAVIPHQYIRHIGRTFYFNSGSIGHALRHDQEPGLNKPDPWAEYALLDVRGSDLSLALRSAHKRSGRPYLNAALAQFSSFALIGVPFLDDIQAVDVMSAVSEQSKLPGPGIISENVVGSRATRGVLCETMKDHIRPGISRKSDVDLTLNGH